MVSRARPSLLLYCQHSVGLGHLIRSLALADGLADHFDVVLLNGGRLPDAVTVPDRVEVVNLPPLGQPAHDVVSLDPSLAAEQALAIRRDTMIAALESHRPAAVVIELFPFGRKKFAAELIPFLDAIHAMGSARPRVLCSVRDLLVGDRPDQADHDDRASLVCNRYFDAVLVHSDPTFAHLEETFRPRTRLTVPVLYTGFVVPASSAREPSPGRRRRRVLVSAGGGMVGERLFRAAVDAHATLREATCADMTIVAGPFAPDDVWDWLTSAAGGAAGLEVIRQVSDLVEEMRCSSASVSQCGYNTSMDLLRAGVPAIVVPYAERRDTEQSDRARRLAAAGAVRVLPQEALSGEVLARELIDLLRRPHVPEVTLDVQGRAASGRIVADLVCGAQTGAAAFAASFRDEGDPA